MTVLIGLGVAAALACYAIATGIALAWIAPVIISAALLAALFLWT